MCRYSDTPCPGTEKAWKITHQYAKEEIQKFLNDKNKALADRLECEGEGNWLTCRVEQTIEGYLVTFSLYNKTQNDDGAAFLSVQGHVW